MKQTFTSYNNLLQYILMSLLAICTTLQVSAAELNILGKSSKAASVQKAISLPALTLASSLNSRLNEFAGPAISVTSNMSTFRADAGNEVTQYYYFEASNIPSDESITVQVNDPFTLSKDGSTYNNTIELGESVEGAIEVYIWVKYKPTNVANHSEVITHSGGGATTKTLTVTGSSAVTPMPVTLVSFNAKKVQKKVILEWITASETNNSHFEIQVSEDPETGFSTAGNIPSKSGNSSVRTSYSFEHSLGGEPGTYYFRLKQVDLDGTSAYSNLVSVKIAQKPETIPILAPNPVTTLSKVYLTSIHAGKLHVMITNTEGASVFANAYQVQAGDNLVALQLPDTLKAGMYFLTTEFNGKYSRLKFLKE